MLRYIYTSEYPSSHQGDATWETHLDVMIAADKYSLSRLEALAYEKCEWLIRNAPQTDSVLFRLVERSWEYADRERRLSKLIASLPAVSGERFPEFFEHTALRQWIDANPDVIRPVIEKHFQSLMKLRSFREKISSDGEMALQQLDRLLAATSVLQVSQTQGGQTRPTR